MKHISILSVFVLLASCVTPSNDTSFAKGGIENGVAAPDSINFAALSKPSKDVSSTRALYGTGTGVTAATRPQPIIVRPTKAAPNASYTNNSNPPGAELKSAEIYPARARAPSAIGQTNATADGDITLNFVNTDIREVIDVVLGETLGLNYAIDPSIDVKITARTVRPLQRGAVLATLENILVMNGLAILPKRGVYQIVPIEATGRSLPSPRPSSTELGFGLHVLPLRFVKADMIMDLMEPYIPPGRTIQTLDSNNVLLFTGTTSEARDLQSLAEIFDVDWLRGRTFALLPVTYANAESITAELETIFGLESQTPLDGVVGFLPIARLNAVLAMSREPSYIAEAKSWVARLDRNAVGAGRSTYVYHVQNARARDLARVLQSLYSSEPTSAPAPVAPNRTSTTFSRDSGGEGLTSSTARMNGNENQISSFVTQNGIRIVSDDSKNAILISCNREQYQEIESVLRQLDTVPLQVSIEATIAEVRLTDELRYGLQWYFRSGQGQGTLSSSTSDTLASVFPGFSFVLDTHNANFVLDALAKITDVRVISSPTMLVLDNERASLQVGDEVPVATRSSVSTFNSDAPVVNQIEFRNTGVILEVVPRVNSSGLILLDVVQEVSDVVATTTSTIDSPTIRQRRLASAIVVNSGESIVLGGLIQDSTTTGSAGVPILSEIPLIGNLFKNTSDNRQRTELLVIITPRIVRDSNEARELTDELRRRLSALKPLQQRLNTPREVGFGKTGAVGRLREFIH